MFALMCGRAQATVLQDDSGLQKIGPFTARPFIARTSVSFQLANHAGSVPAYWLARAMRFDSALGGRQVHLQPQPLAGLRHALRFGIGRTTGSPSVSAARGFTPCASIRHWENDRLTLSLCRWLACAMRFNSALGERQAHPQPAVGGFTPCVSARQGGL
jgi:hypothetical protein